MSFAVFEVNGNKKKLVSDDYSFPKPAKDLRDEMSKHFTDKKFIVRHKYVDDGHKVATWHDL